MSKRTFIDILEPESPHIRASDKNLSVYVETVSKDRELSRVFDLPIKSIEDSEEAAVHIEEEIQHQSFKPWLEFFRYVGAQVEWLQSDSLYLLKCSGSWHDLLLKEFPAKSQLLVEDDEFWRGYSTVSIMLIDRTTFKILNGTLQISPSAR